MIPNERKAASHVLRDLQIAQGPALRIGGFLTDHSPSAISTQHHSEAASSRRMTVLPTGPAWGSGSSRGCSGKGIYAET